MRILALFAGFVLSAACAGEVLEELPTRGGAPDERGPFLAHVVDVGAGHRLWLPSTREDAAEPALFPLPLVLLVPGFSAGPGDYADTARHLASHGFAVVAAQHGFDFLGASLCMTQREGLVRVESAVNEVRRLARSPGVWSGVVDERAAVGAVGHSYGGKVSFWLDAIDAVDVGAIVALDPVDGGGDERRPGWCEDRPEDFAPIAPRLAQRAAPPSLLLGAGRSGECAPERGNAEVLFAALHEGGSDATLWRLPRASHADFVDAAATDTCLACAACPASGESGADVLGLSRGAAVAFLRARLLSGHPERDAFAALDADFLRAPAAGAVAIDVVTAP